MINEALRETIIRSIGPNGRNAITGEILQGVLLNIVSAVPEPEPEKPEEPIKVIEKTHAELLSEMQAGNLIPGRVYRITDYVTEFEAESTAVGAFGSAKNPFDLLVMAQSSSGFYPQARAIRKKGSPSGTLEKWELMYDIAGTITLTYNRFAKGTIYYMKDDKGNEASFDFKNVYVIAEDDIRRYMFSDGEGGEGSSLSSGNSVVTEIISRAIQWPNIYFEGPDCMDNIFVKPNTRKETQSYDTVVGAGSRSNIVLTDSYGNTIQGSYNVLGPLCYRNTIVGNSNTLSTNCHKNVLYGNNHCLGNACDSNTTGEKCANLYFGNYCRTNSLGNNCTNIRLGNGCSNNKLGAYNNSITFGNTCIGNVIGTDANNPADYVRFITFGDGVQYVLLHPALGSGSASSSNYLQKITIASGFGGTGSPERVTVKVNRSLEWEMGVARNSTYAVVRFSMAPSINVDYPSLDD